MKLKKKYPEKKHFFQIYTVMVVLLLFFLSPTCRHSSPEKELLKSLENCQKLVNEYNLSALKDLIATDYIDSAGNNRQEVLNMLATYFQNYPQFQTKILGRTVKLNQSKNSAAIHCDVSLTASAGGLSISLFTSGRSLMRFELSFRQEGNRWLINSASWREIGLEEILPETIPHLPKTLFVEK